MSVWFQKWYKPETRLHNGSLCWFVVRVDKPELKGQYIGPVRITGKSWAAKAQEVSDAKNARIIQKRQELNTYEI